VSVVAGMGGMDFFSEHPEGGRFREVYRSVRSVRLEGGAVRCGMTHIYFQLRSGEVSHFHRLGSDEVWSLYRGEGVRLWLWDGVSSEVREVELSVGSGEFCHVVPSGWWQAAEPLGLEVLVGCTVAPGFEFEDFELMGMGSEDGRRLMGVRAGLGYLVSRGGG
jgi:predicted cupin superfamily sugar epimerase